MIHAVRLGPVGASTPPVFAYVAFLPGGEPEILEAAGDPQGLAALRTALKGQPFTCEPALAEAAGRLGLQSGPLPPAVVMARARIAYELAAGVQHGASRPDALAALLAAAGKLWTARVWEVIAPDDPLRVVFAAGQSLVQGEVALDASDPGRPRLVLCDERGALASLEGRSGEERLARLTAGPGLSVEFATEPAWAAAILEESFRLPRVPTPERRRDGGVAPVTTQDLVLAAALMEAVVAFAARGDDGEVEAEVAAASLVVKARLGLVQRDSTALGALFPETALTPVGAGAPGATPDAAGGAAGSDEDAMSPEELAALLKGGPVAAPAPARPPADAAAEASAAVDDAVSPEELAALLKGAGGPAAEPAASPGAAAAEAVAPVAEPAAATAATAEAPAAATAAGAAPEPEDWQSKPLHPVGPEPAAPPRRIASAPARPPPEADEEGWLARTWRALKGGTGASREPAGRAARRAAPPAPRAAPAPPRAPAPRREPAPDPAGPFAPFARALHVEIPSEPPPASPAEAAQASALAKQLAGAAAGKEGFVSFPAVAFQIVELVHSPQADARGVAGFISRDPGLAADVLAVANSAAFRGVSEAASVRDAVARLGLQEVGRVASAVSARALLVPAVPGGVPSTRLFSRAVAVATAASSTALRVRGARSDHVWLAGLLHDVGLALGASALAAAAGTPARVAAQALEAAHVEIGAAALRGWGLPQYLVDVCARHHDAEVPAGPALVDLHLVRLTSALARLSDPEVAARAAREIVQSARALGLDPHAVRALAAELRDAEKKAALLVR